MSYKSQPEGADPVNPYDESTCSLADDRYTICRARISLLLLFFERQMGLPHH
jgi:hypothetical protein